MKATDELQQEHQGIELMLRVLKAVSARFGGREPPPAPHVDGIVEFLTIFVDKCHHGKEEEFLFPALEAAGVPREAGPIGVMLREHRQGRQLVVQLREFLGQYRSGKKEAAVGIQQTIQEYVDLLSRHIVKENSVLFPMADDRLDVRADVELFEAFQRLERERVGPGKHEAFQALLEELRDAYLK
ncbi:MAG: hemerythrin domain-containing protein [Desulfobacteraceae bacterium]|nr:hemerythrin domain-containing protein [Desulfobacteraceae bacterium]